MEATETHVYAYCIEPNCTTVLDLHPYGVRPTWQPEIIWDVARREMRNLFHKSVTCWEIK
jgi:hypothetical protein